jgi:hypothetical protein
MGSAVHARSLRPDQVRAMIGMEMIGCFSGEQQFPLEPLKLFYPSGSDYIVVVGRLGDAALVRRIKRGLRAGGGRVASINAPRSIPGVDYSDHANYWDAGMPAVMITDTSFYRKPRSTRRTPSTTCAWHRSSKASRPYCTNSRPKREPERKPQPEHLKVPDCVCDQEHADDDRRTTIEAQSRRSDYSSHAERHAPAPCACLRKPS